MSIDWETVAKDANLSRAEFTTELLTSVVAMYATMLEHAEVTGGLIFTVGDYILTIDRKDK